MASDRLSGLRILVLGAGASHEPAFVTWARHGCRTTLVDGGESEGYEPLADDFLAEEVYDHLHPDVDRLAGVAARHDVVLTLSDMAQATAAEVAERAGLRGTGVRAARLARDKHLQRAAAERAGLPVARSVPVARGDGIDALDLPVPPPGVVKPVDAGGSAAVSLVRTRAELAAACARAVAQSFSGRCVVEEYLAGTEWSIEALVVDGQVRFTSHTAKTLVGPDCFIERRHVVGAEPGPVEMAAVDELTHRMVELFEVQTALCHLEVRLDEARATPIEMAVRPAGDGIVDLVRLARGRDLYAELVAALADREPGPPRAPVAPLAGTEFLIATGTVRRTPSPASVVGSAPGIRYAVTKAHVGQTLGAVDANWRRAGRAVATGESVVELERSLTAAMEAMAAEMGVTRR
ncbi:MAG TPA: ATP-grasp domain-containing protein [Actinomycetota bacterium]|nr:ATP-grasp domain-containing protein [Actinomycetota bacterium]